MSEQGYPRLIPKLVAEVAYMCQRAGASNDRDLARMINRWARSSGLIDEAESYLSDEGFTTIMREGGHPQVETLRKAARFFRTLEPWYSVARLFRAAGWYDDDDPEVDPERVGPALSPQQARLCSLVPQLLDQEAANLADNATMLIANRQRTAR